jgi:hypothetical protein
MKSVSKRKLNLKTQYHKLGLYIDTIWTKDDLTAEQKGDLIRNAAIRLLQGESRPEPSAPHAGGREPSADHKALESDVSALMGGGDGLSDLIDRVAKPRRMTRTELRRALTQTRRTTEDEILESLHRAEQAQQSVREDAQRLLSGR